jgi:hypothetical protein
MSEFVAPNEQGHEPWCNWDNHKKERVFGKVAKIINDNKRIGVGVALPKEVYDDQVPEKIKEHYGREHYSLAVRMCMMEISKWRDDSNIF